MVIFHNQFFGTRPLIDMQISPRIDGTDSHACFHDPKLNNASFQMVTTGTTFHGTKRQSHAFALSPTLLWRIQHWCGTIINHSGIMAPFHGFLVHQAALGRFRIGNLSSWNCWCFCPKCINMCQHAHLRVVVGYLPIAAMAIDHRAHDTNTPSAEALRPVASAHPARDFLTGAPLVRGAPLACFTTRKSMSNDRVNDG